MSDTSTMSGPLGILTALPEEARGVVERMQNVRTTDRAIRGEGGGSGGGGGVRLVFTGTLGGVEVVVSTGHVGKVASGVAAAELVFRHGVSGVVMLGVAGGLGESQVGDIVVASASLQHDMDASPLFPRHEIPLTGISRFDADSVLSGHLRAAAAHAAHTLGDHVEAQVLRELEIGGCRAHSGLIVSGDRFVGCSRYRGELSMGLPDALAVDMETASVAQACAQLGVRCAAVRVVSDCAGDEAHRDFVRFLQRVASPQLGLIAEALASALRAEPATRISEANQPFNQTRAV